ncbi:MAG: prepilin-type N-terminal cleavage/methylation domain-containing protein [Planctomycetes bacterium]|nr:prepilin-type N-terminal cleavage/methylation domain-containing protein [Planctomycetota bacterium]
MRRHGYTRRGFSLLEVVIVVAIIAILAAIGIPRMSRGAKGASDAALTGDLATLRNAIDLYAAEHSGAFPTTIDVTAQLTQYTNISGVVSTTKTTTAIYGPYMRSIPPLPVGTKKGSAKIADANGVGVGWIYSSTDGTIKANTTDGEVDEAGTKYNAY